MRSLKKRKKEVKDVDTEGIGDDLETPDELDVKSIGKGHRPDPQPLSKHVQHHLV